MTSRHGVADNGYLSEVVEKCHRCCCKTCIWNHALRAIKNGPYQKDWFVFYNFGLKINCATALILSEGFPGDLECVALLVLLWYLFSIFLFNENFGIIDRYSKSCVSSIKCQNPCTLFLYIIFVRAVYWAKTINIL